MTERAQIEREINEMLSMVEGSLAVRTLANILGEFLERTDAQIGDSLTIAVFNAYLSTVIEKANDVADHPEQWVNERGRFQLASYSMLRNPDDDTCAALRRVLAKMDATYRDSFSMEGALDYVRKVSACANRLRMALGKRGEQ